MFKEGLFKSFLLVIVVCGIYFGGHYIFIGRHIDKINSYEMIEIVKKVNPNKALLMIGETGKEYGQHYIRLEITENGFSDKKIILRAVVNNPEKNEIEKLARERGIDKRGARPSYSWLFWVAIVIYLIFLFKLVSVKVRMGNSGGTGGFGADKSAQARRQEGTEEDVSFDDVAGIDEAKEELEEIVDFLKNPKKYTRLGGRIPSGVLLEGPPGCGKTLLARAIAGEAGRPFFSISGSDFVEMFVGVGASRVRNLFRTGEKNSPCIIFIDEIDAVGGHRGQGVGGSGNQEREQTLNQLLVEMDGFKNKKDVILVAATNRSDMLDPALLRPGRIDRKIFVDLPDVLGREKILKTYLEKLPEPVSDDVSAKHIAKATPGFSGADIENLVNEAALLAAKLGKEQIDMSDFENSKDRVYMGLEKKSRIIKEEDRKITAVHEGGHAFLAWLLLGEKSVNKVTIIPRGKAGGVTWIFPDECEYKNKEQLCNELIVGLGGRASEEILIGHFSTGAAGDIGSITDLAQKMVRSWGMSNKLGHIAYAQSGMQMAHPGGVIQSQGYSEATADLIDKEILKLTGDAYKSAIDLMTKNKIILEKIKESLLENETLTGSEISKIIRSVKPEL